MSHDESESHWSERHLWEIQPLRDLGAIALVIAVAAAVYLLRAVFLPVGIAFALAYLFNPLIDFGEKRWSVSRSLAIALILAALALTGTAFVFWIGPVVAEEITSFTTQVPHYAQTLARHVEGNVGEYDVQLGAWVDRVMNEPIKALRTFFTGTSQAFGFIGGFITASTYVLITVLLIPIYFYIIALHFHGMRARLDSFIPVSRRQRVRDVVQQMDMAVSSFVHGRLLIALIMAGLFSIGWSPLLTNVPYWLVLGILTGVLSLIPFAASLGWLLALLVITMDLSVGESMTGWDWTLRLGLPTLVYGVVQFLEGWFLTPWIQGYSLNLSVFTIMIAVFIGAAIGGVFGMLLAIPIAACTKIILKETVMPDLLAWANSH